MLARFSLRNPSSGLRSGKKNYEMTIPESPRREITQNGAQSAWC
jgi:hypothetical protein